jgi:predicted phosphodiesterase
MKQLRKSLLAAAWCLLAPLAVWAQSSPARNVVSRPFDPAQTTLVQLESGAYGLLALDANSNLVNAVTLNTGGNAQFVFGPYVSAYPLGCYGVDTNANTAWAVVDYAGPFQPGPIARRNADSLANLRIAILSDIHIMATNLLISDGPAFQAYLAGDRKMLGPSSTIGHAVFDAVIAQQPDVVVFTGDLTKDGELVSHLEVSNLMARLVADGAKVFVVPGNHDVNNTNAMSFDGATTTPVPNITPEQFRAIYGPFGYNQAIAQDTNSLAYVAEPAPGLWILGMDACQYDGNADPVAGSFSPERLNWITNQMVLGQAQGKVVFPMMHHNILEHFPGQATYFPQYVVADYQVIAPLFASLGVKTVFTGHFHAQDVAQAQFGGGLLYDIETGSTVTRPCPYRILDLQPDGQLVIRSHLITGINYNLGSAPDFTTYEFNFLTNGLLNLTKVMLEEPPFDLSVSTAAYVAPAATEALMDHYVGDEPGLMGASPITSNIVFSLLAGAAGQQELGDGIVSIITDTPPADNNLTIDLTPGVPTGPAAATAFTNRPAILSWAPIWGATNYAVTLSGPGGGQTFNLSGTSLALPASLPNGAYSWTVTPSDGSTSPVGTFTLAYAPALGISGPNSSGAVAVSWPAASLPGYQLQFSPDLSASNNWVPATNSSFFRVTTNGFYRLSR